MTTVTHVLQDPRGEPLKGRPVAFRLVADGNPFHSDKSAVTTLGTVYTDDEGQISIDLLPTSGYEHDGAVIEVDARAGQFRRSPDLLWYITVPDTGTHKLRDLLTDAPDATIPTSDAPRFLLFTTGWPPRGTSPRATFFIGGSAAADAPDDVNIQAGDLWFPATA